MFPQLFETVPDALILVDEAGRIVLANRQAERLFGYPADGLMELGIEQLIPEDARERHRRHRSGYMHAPRVRPMGGAGMALIGQRRDGAQFPVEIALSPLQTEQGTRYLASIRDISETQRAKQALVRARYDALVARIGQQAVELANEEGLITKLPELLVDTLGAESMAIALLREKPLIEVRSSIGLSRPIGNLYSDPEQWQQLSSSQPLIIEDLETSSRQLPLLDGKAGSGAAVPLLDRGRPMGVLVAQSRGTRAFDHDAMHLLQSVANLVAAMIQRRRTEEQLAHSQRLEAVGQLTGGIAHDFNNLLTVMSGSLQLLEARCDGDSESAELIASALRSVGRGAELTRKLLAFAGRQRLSPCPVSPPRLLADLEQMLRRTLGEATRLIVDCPQTVPPVYVDVSQLDSALLNLVLNARDAMPRGGEIRLSVAETRVDSGTGRTALEPGAYIVFSVADTGLGMTPETLARAVEPFFTTKQGRGSGLGLSMAYGFVEQSGGHLHIDSRLGYGTRVMLYLPAAVESPAHESPASLDRMEGDGETILIVEDDPGVRDIAAAFVRSLGYRAHAVASAAQAMEQVAADPDIHVLFSDVMLGPGMNGAELALAARRRRPALAVLLATGYEDSPALNNEEARAFPLLRKPYSREDLAAALRRSIEKR